MSRFKPGDRVVLMRPKAMNAVPGATATVVVFDPKVHFRYGDPDKYLWIKWDDTPEREMQQHGGYYPDYFDLIVEKPMVDFTKPVTTRDGRPVRILCTDRKGTDHPVVGLVESKDCEELLHWTSSGFYNRFETRTALDLINPPVKKYLALCRNGASGGYYDTHEKCEREGRKCKGYIKTIEVEL